MPREGRRGLNPYHNLKAKIEIFQQSAITRPTFPAGIFHFTKEGRD